MCANCNKKNSGRLRQGAATPIRERVREKKPKNGLFVNAIKFYWDNKSNSL